MFTYSTDTYQTYHISSVITKTEFTNSHSKNMLMKNNRKYIINLHVHSGRYSKAANEYLWHKGIMYSKWK